MMRVKWKKHILKFKRPAKTSRSILLDNVVYYITIESNGLIGVGECNALTGLSLDDRPDFEDKLEYFTLQYAKQEKLQEWVEELKQDIYIKIYDLY